jgi:hypothetical protein
MNTHLRAYIGLFAIALGGTTLSLRAQPDYIFPSVPFDEAKAAAQLEPGTGELAGFAAAKEADSKWYQIANLSKGHRARRGVQITVYPVTSYLEEWLKLRKKHGSRALISPEAFAYRIIIRTNDKGEFYIPNLKPGRYYLEAVVRFTTREVSEFVQTGTEVISQGGNIVASNPVYTAIYDDFQNSKYVFAYAEIKKEGGQAIVKLRN